ARPNRRNWTAAPAVRRSAGPNPRIARRARSSHRNIRWDTPKILRVRSGELDQTSTRARFLPPFVILGRSERSLALEPLRSFAWLRMTEGADRHHLPDQLPLRPVFGFAVHFRPEALREILGSRVAEDGDDAPFLQCRSDVQRGNHIRARRDADEKSLFARQPD